HGAASDAGHGLQHLAAQLAGGAEFLRRDWRLFRLVLAQARPDPGHADLEATTGPRRWRQTGAAATAAALRAGPADSAGHGVPDPASAERPAGGALVSLSRRQRRPLLGPP